MSRLKLYRFPAGIGGQRFDTAVAIICKVRNASRVVIHGTDLQAGDCLSVRQLSLKDAEQALVDVTYHGSTNNVAQHADRVEDSSCSLEDFLAELGERQVRHLICPGEQSCVCAHLLRPHL